MLALKCIRVKPPPAGQWHDLGQSAALERLAAATWFMASDVCSRQALTCLPGGATAMSNDVFTTMANCMLGGVAPVLREKVGKPVVVPRRTGDVGARRTDKGLGLPLDAMASNLLNADVGGAGGGFELRHDEFRDALFAEARAAKYSALKEFEIGVEHGLAAVHATALRGAAAAHALAVSEEVPDERLGTAEMAIRAAARASVAAAQRAGCSTDMLRKYGKTAKGMRVDLGLEGPEGRRAMRLYEVKTVSFCASRYRVRCPEGGLTWADKRAREAVQERDDQAAVLDNGLFRGTNSTPMATALRKQGGVTALVVGGCCELNADAHRLLAEIGALRGRQAARESGEGERACGALELLQLRQRMSVRIWSSYQRYICARVQYADPTHDTQRQHAHQAEVAAAKQELQAQRHINEAHMHRVGGPTVWGV